MAAQQQYFQAPSCDTPAVAAFARPHENHKPAAGFFRNDTEKTNPAIKRDRHDEHSVPASPPSSGIEREEGDTDGFFASTERQCLGDVPCPVAKHHGNSSSKNNNSALRSGNIEHLDDNGNREEIAKSTGKTSSDEASNDGTAISAVALLLLAASTTADSSRLQAGASSEAPASRGLTGVSANGSLIAETSSASSVDAVADESAGGAVEDERHHTDDGENSMPSTVSNSVHAREVWTMIPHPTARLNPTFVHDVPYGGGGGGGGGGGRTLTAGQIDTRGVRSAGGWHSGGSGVYRQPSSTGEGGNLLRRRSDGRDTTSEWAAACGQPQHPFTNYPSLPAEISGNHLASPSPVSTQEERMRSWHSRNNHFASSGSDLRLTSQQHSGQKGSLAPSKPSQEEGRYRHNDRPWNGGQDDYCKPSSPPKLPLSTRGQRDFFPVGVGPHCYNRDDNDGRVVSCSGMDDLFLNHHLHHEQQPPKQQQPKQQPKEPSLLPSAHCASAEGGALRVQSPWGHDVAVLGQRSPASMRTTDSGRSHTVTVRSPRGKRSPSPPRTAGRKRPEGYRSTAWDGVSRGRKAMVAGGTTATSGAPGASGASGCSRRWTSHSTGGVGRGSKISSSAKVGGSGRVHQGESSSDAGCQQPQLQSQLQPQPQQQLQLVMSEQGRPGWSRKRSSATVGKERTLIEKQGDRAPDELRPVHATDPAGTGQWGNPHGPSTASASAAEVGAVGFEPRPPKRHRPGGAQRAPVKGNSKVRGSRRPLAMDVDKEASSDRVTAASKNGTAGCLRRPSPRKKSKNPVWSQFRKACDRCTDKKVRCDRSDPSEGIKACTPCRRADVPCLFGICRRSGPRDAHGHKTATAGIIMKRNDFEKVTERFGQCRTAMCRFVNQDGSFWREHFHCRVGDCSFAGRNMSELLLHRGSDHPEEQHLGETNSLSAFPAPATTTTAAAAAAASASDVRLTSELVEVAADVPRTRARVVC